MLLYDMNSSHLVLRLSDERRTKMLYSIYALYSEKNWCLKASEDVSDQEVYALILFE